MIDGSVLQSVQRCFEKKSRVVVKMVVKSFLGCSIRLDNVLLNFSGFKNLVLKTLRNQRRQIQVWKSSCNSHIKVCRQLGLRPISYSLRLIVMTFILPELIVPEDQKNIDLGDGDF